MERIDNYIHGFLWDVIAQLGHIFNGGLIRWKWGMGE